MTLERRGSAKAREKAPVRRAGAARQAQRRQAPVAVDKVARIQTILDELYPVPAIPLQHADPFTLLVAVVLSAQTTDKKVNQVTPALFAAAPTPEALAGLSVAEIAAFIREVGLAPQKAKALKGLAERLVSEHGSRVPDTFEALVELPGVGRKTANVVLSQAFGQPAFPVDTHIHRLAARWGLSRGRSPDHTERDLCSVFPEASWNRLHLQIIYFGREHCPALRHDPGACPICSWAATRQPLARAPRQRASAGQSTPGRTTSSKSRAAKSKAGKSGALESAAGRAPSKAKPSVRERRSPAR